MQSSALTDSIPPLPVAEVLPALNLHLVRDRNAVLVAPPGAGKTSLVPPALLPCDWLQARKILLLLPRRLAARAAAERIAALLGEAPGQRVGYRTRLEAKPGSRIECVTTGIFTSQLLADAAIEGVGALIFDEVHERSLEMDLAMALALDVQQLREDLRILAMSATIDGEKFADVLGSAAIFRAEGRSFAVEQRHIGRGQGRHDLPVRMAAAIRTGLADMPGSLLAFLPGVAEIERTAAELHLPEGIVLHKLHGQADAKAQRLALQPGGRKVVLATNIAETSLTVDGVRTVVDSGLTRRPSFDRASGLVRLQTLRVSQASAAQRAGRAGRQAPGLVIRLWDEAETAGLLPFDPPEILAADLAALMLRLGAWGVRDPAELRWLDPPPEAAVQAARSDLRLLGAMDAEGGLTAHGRRMARLPLAPRLAHLLLVAARSGQADLAARIALLLEERGLGGRSTDIEARLQMLGRDRGPRAQQVLGLARRWAAAATRLQPADGSEPLAVGLLVATAYPDRVARRRQNAGRSGQAVGYRMANGRGADIDAAEALGQCEWLAVADAGGAAAAARIRLAAAIPDSELQPWLTRHTQISQTLTNDTPGGHYRMLRRETLGAIEIAVTETPADAQLLVDALVQDVRQRGIQALRWPDAEWRMLLRLRFAASFAEGAALPDLSDAGLLQALESWLGPRLDGVSRLGDIRLSGVWLDWLGWPAQQLLAELAPEYFHSPAGTRHVIDYAAEGGAEVELRVQAMFGCGVHPAIAGGRVPLLLSLTSPAGRPLARTRDIAGFWKAGWRDVQRQMKGRYPKHPWPDDPLAAAATVRSKAADRRRG